ncbi:MAG: 2-aminoethylphosphonate--pyruvate transaminase [Alphaproteobacteria bacterium]
MVLSRQAPERAERTGNREFLLTPGPLTTSLEVKRAMLRDWGSRDRQFIALNARVRARLVRLAGGGEAFTCVPVQGSGTFAVEATLGTLVPRGGHMLVLVNGAYGERMMKIAKVTGRPAIALTSPEDRTPDLASLDAVLAGDTAIRHVAAVHCETTSGILNPIAAIAGIVARHGRSLIVDAMSAFGALPLDVQGLPCDAVVASSNKCLEGVPGVGFAIVRRAVLERCEGNAHSLALDLHDQWRAMAGNGQWRFTPPTHVLAAFDRALAEHEAEGGNDGRLRRYEANRKALVEGMRALGFETLLADAVQAPIIVTFRMPGDPGFDFDAFYDRLARQGYVIYPGKLTVAPSFRIGCIGHLTPDDMTAAVAAVADVVREMGVTRLAPLAASA